MLQNLSQPSGVAGDCRTALLVVVQRCEGAPVEPNV